MISEYCVDMTCWDAGSPERFFNPEKIADVSGKRAAQKIFKQIKEGYEILVNQPKTYNLPEISETIENTINHKQIIQSELSGSIMGSCPVASEKTRCCNLHTLDAVQQCGFNCSYCSIQSFYHDNQINFITNLVHHLQNLELDPNKIYHIGTGQSSDSLMWGNHSGLLDALCEFAQAHPNVILEFKSKSGRIDYFEQNEPPPNMIFTWSLNTPKVIYHEERGSASLNTRLQSARRLADIGCPVGFHFHPIVWYKDWEADYSNLVNMVTDAFLPEETVMISLGTLTFIKSVIKRLRQHMKKTTILRMPMEEIGGKLSYPFAIKKELFRTVYDSFPTPWKEQVFFYLCMEDLRLWSPVFNREYESNEEFESAMTSHYLAKIRSINAQRVGSGR